MIEQTVSTNCMRSITLRSVFDGLYSVPYFHIGMFLAFHVWYSEVVESLKTRIGGLKLDTKVGSRDILFRLYI